MMQIPNHEIMSNSIPPFPRHIHEVDQTYQELVTIPKQRKNLMARVAIGAVVSLMPASCIARAYTQNEWLRTMNNDSGEMIEYAEGCEPFTLIRTTEEGKPVVVQGTATEQEINQTLQTEAKFKATRSAAENFEAKSFDLAEAIREWIDIFRNKQQTFVSTYTGAVFHLYSDKPDAFKHFDAEAFDRAAHMILDPSVAYSHKAVDQFAECMRHRFIDPNGPRELEGKRINIYIPSTYGLCWVNGQFQDKPPRAKAREFCDSTGGTKYELIVPTGIIPVKSSWVVTMPTSSNIDYAERAISENITHEFGHLLTQAGGLPFELIPNEKVVDMLESESLEQLYPEGPPRIIKYQLKPSAQKMVDLILGKND